MKEQFLKKTTSRNKSDILNSIFGGMAVVLLQPKVHGCQPVNPLAVCRYSDVHIQSWPL